MRASDGQPQARPLAGDRLAGRVALISGAGSEGPFGVGAAVAFLFARQGASVGVLDISPVRGRQTAETILEAGGNAITIAADVRDASACAAAILQVHDAFGPVDVLVNSAAPIHRGDLVTVSDEAWRETIEIVLTGALNLTRAAAPGLKRSGGAVVNVSSIAATRAFGAIAYATAKGGLEAMTRDMAYTLGPAGVRANAVSLGPLSTPLTQNIPEPQRSARLARAMLPHEGEAWDAAFAVLFLASDEARWITATTLCVDAGVSVAGKSSARVESD